MSRPISGLQAHILGVLKDTGAADAAELSRHLRVDGSVLASPLRGLEGRGMIGRTYTGHHFRSDHAYVITDAGREAVREVFGDEDEGG